MSVITFFFSLEFLFLKTSYNKTAFLMQSSDAVSAIIKYLKLHDVDVTQSPFSQNDGHYSWVVLGNQKNLLTFPKVTTENLLALPSDLSRFLNWAFQDLKDDIPLGELQAL